jgi:hypothetical protein
MTPPSVDRGSDVDTPVRAGSDVSTDAFFPLNDAIFQSPPPAINN